MVPASYHYFFSSSASVAGALIGLLFVAISVSPHKLSGEGAAFGFQARAGVAFSALVNALMVSLIALLPETDLGWSAMALAITGISSSAGLFLIASVRLRGKTDPDRGRLLLVLLTMLYVVQLVNAIVLIEHPHGTREIAHQAVILIVLFVVGIARSWELVGGGDANAVKIIRHALADRRHAADAAHHGEEHDPQT